MRLTTSAFIAGTLLFGLIAGPAHAGPPQGDEDGVLDLSAIPGGPTLYLKCSRGDLTNDCGVISIWQQSNGVPGLQIAPKPYGGQQRPRDTPLLA